MMGCNGKEAEPLKTLRELLIWTPSQCSAQWNEALARVPQLPPERTHSRPCTLLCHDMKGGYTDDRFLSGCSNNEAYHFVYWSGIDIFVYFSHHFVTVPPPGWTAAAHTNGVPVLGTVITEAEPGTALCNELFSSLQSVERAVQQLLRIAEHHKLQGWLINIENALQPVAVGLVLVFLQKLTSAMRSIDSCSCVLWYDSITQEGKLKWQDELNDQNSCFYECCDAIFLNYSWQEKQLVASRNYARAFPGRREPHVTCDLFNRNSEAAVEVRSDSNSGVDGGSDEERSSGGATVGEEAAVAATEEDTDESRYTNKFCSVGRDGNSAEGAVCALPTLESAEEFKVFVGVDVFGRNFYKGGGFNTNKAMEVIRRHRLSAAIFAPAWTHETLGCQDFPENDRRFWRLLFPYLTQHGPSRWPVYSTFGSGCGAGRYREGELTDNKNFFNLCEQSLLPNLAECSNSSHDGSVRTVKRTHDGVDIATPGVGDDRVSGVSLTLCCTDAWMGGSCLALTCAGQDRGEARLWCNCSLVCSSPALSVILVYKAEEARVRCTAEVQRQGASFRLLINFYNDSTDVDTSGVCLAAHEQRGNGWVSSTLRTPGPGADIVISTIAVSVPGGSSLKLGLLSIDKT